MNKRAQDLVNAPASMSVAPHTTLTTVRDINQAVQRNINGGNYGVYCTGSTTGPNVYRVYRARTHQGQLQVETPHGWVRPSLVYSEG